MSSLKHDEVRCVNEMKTPPVNRLSDSGRRESNADLDQTPKKVDEKTIELLDRVFGQLPISVVLTDSEGRIIMINDHYAEFLNTRKTGVVGRLVQEVVPNTRLPIVLATGQAEISAEHFYGNKTKAIVHRIPFFADDGSVAGCLGIVLFESVEELQNLAKAYQDLHTQLSAYQNEIKSVFRAKYSFADILGESLSMRKNKGMARRMALSGANILITGESGTGKELWAHAIHRASQRKEFPFVSVNCGAIPENLLESELFGYEEGAFTGAKKGGKLGKFQIANGGTLFLDEIGDMPLLMQVKILRVLQEREIEKVGGTGAERVDVRIIAATHRDLQQMAHDGTFREDLFYRLNILSLHLQPLREHPEDISLLIQHFLTKYGSSTGTVKRVAPETMTILRGYNWPGNVRELSAVIERLLVTADAEVITPLDLPMEICLANKEREHGYACGLDQALAGVEREMITRALRITHNSKTAAAKLLGIPRSRLYRKLEQFDFPELRDD
ncbi:limonene hydroxylase [Peptococcaceae bacterium CEB3]|nr:limonene hydroxylase [Peptococcaceae bacterium CEB3]